MARGQIPLVEALEDAGFFRTGAQAYEGTCCPAVSHSLANPHTDPWHFIRTTFHFTPGQQLVSLPARAFWRARVVFEPAASWPLGLASVMRLECSHSHEMDWPRSHEGRAGPMQSPDAILAGKGCAPHVDQRKWGLVPCQRPLEALF